MNKEFNASVEELGIVTKYLKKLLNSNSCIVLLEGDLASGKTTLIKELLKEFNIKDDVTSPTFSLQNIYENRFFHYDIYNKSLEEFISLGLLEEFEKDGIHFVEWSNKKLETILKDYGFKTVKIDIEKLEKKRRYIIYEA